MKQVLQETRYKLDVMKIYDNNGYTPLHYAAYKNKEQAVLILIQFISQVVSDPRYYGGTGEQAEA